MHNDVAKIIGATPAPKGALVIPATVSDGYYAHTVTEIYGGAFYGNAISESAVVWYEPVNATIAYLRIYSFSLGCRLPTW